MASGAGGGRGLPHWFFDVSRFWQSDRAIMDVLPVPDCACAITSRPAFPPTAPGRPSHPCPAIPLEHLCYSGGLARQQMDAPERRAPSAQPAHLVTRQALHAGRHGPNPARERGERKE